MAKRKSPSSSTSSNGSHQPSKQPPTRGDAALSPHSASRRGDPLRHSATSPPRRFVVGISGASGALYAMRLLELLLAGGHEVHLVVTEFGARLLHDELGITRITFEGLFPPSPPSSSSLVAHRSSLLIHPHKDVGAVIASGSFLHDGMIVIPCSSAALGYIATGSGTNLLCRAAMVTLKERRRLILVHRESPLSLIDIRNMEAVTQAGAIVAPANPGWYLKPRRLEDLVDFVVGKCLDLLGVEHDLNTRWGAETKSRGANPESRAMSDEH